MPTAAMDTHRLMAADRAIIFTLTQVYTVYYKLLVRLFY
jgi:hypothetical protein